MKDPIPKVGQTYDFYDDGKIHKGRHELVTITKIIPFNEAPQELINLWREEILDYWKEPSDLYSSTTDYFIIGESSLFKNKDENSDYIFVRTIQDEWFNIGFLGGLLDVTGELTKRLNDTTNNT
jgi:hypothetical protein